MRIGECADISFRLVEEKIEFIRTEMESFTINFDVVIVGVGLAAKFRDGVAVDSNASGHDQFLSLSAGTDAGLGNQFLEPLDHCDFAVWLSDSWLTSRLEESLDSVESTNLPTTSIELDSICGWVSSS